MIELFLKYKKSTKKITVSKSYSSEDLSHLIAHSFGVKDKIIGLTDPFGKFYDLQYVSKNLNTLGKQTFSLVTTSDIANEETPIAKENNISFGNFWILSQHLKLLMMDQKFSKDIKSISTIRTKTIILTPLETGILKIKGECKKVKNKKGRNMSTTQALQIFHRKLTVESSE